MMCLKGIQRPIRIGHHSNSPLGADQDGHFRRSVAGTHCVFRRIEDLNGVVDEPAHRILIGMEERSLKLFYLGKPEAYPTMSYAYSAVQCWLPLAQAAIHGQHLAGDEI
jgi:hypothetical protein